MLLSFLYFFLKVLGVVVPSRSFKNTSSKCKFCWIFLFLRHSTFPPLYFQVQGSIICNLLDKTNFFPKFLFHPNHSQSSDVSESTNCLYLTLTYIKLFRDSWFWQWNPTTKFNLNYPQKSTQKIHKVCHLPGAPCDRNANLTHLPAATNRQSSNPNKNRLAPKRF